MTPTALYFLLFLASFFGVKATVQLAPTFGLTDKPDGARKLQRRATPVGGGLVVVALFVASVVVAQFCFEEYDGAFSTPLAIVAAFFAALGLADDRRGLGGVSKLLWELAPLCAYAFWTTRTYGADAALQFGAFQLRSTTAFFAFVVLWLGVCVNSVNLLDGADGFASTLTTFCCFALAFVAGCGPTRDFETEYDAFTLAAATLGFLALNFPPAKIYLGDSGSLPLGFLLGVLALRVCSDGNVVRPFPCVCLLTLPIVDSGCAVVRRLALGRSVFSPDLEHLHHRLQRRFGEGVPTLLALAALQTPLCVAAVWASLGNDDACALGTFGAYVAALPCVGIFGRAEWREVAAALAGLVASARSDASGVFVEARPHEESRRFWLATLADAKTQDCAFLRIDVDLPREGLCWSGKWRARGRVNERTLVKLETPLGIDRRVVGRLTVAFNSERTTFEEATAIVEALRRQCLHELEPFGRSVEYYPIEQKLRRASTPFGTSRANRLKVEAHVDRPSGS